LSDFSARPRHSLLNPRCQPNCATPSDRYGTNGPPRRWFPGIFEIGGGSGLDLPAKAPLTFVLRQYDLLKTSNSEL
jgi:hypothetical protein